VLDQHHVVRYRGTNLSRAVHLIETILGNDEVASLVRLTLEAFDKNNDQRIEKGELPADKQAILDSADRNKDGFLTADALSTYIKTNVKTTTASPSAPDKR